MWTYISTRMMCSAVIYTWMGGSPVSQIEFTVRFAVFADGLLLMLVLVIHRLESGGEKKKMEQAPCAFGLPHCREKAPEPCHCLSFCGIRGHRGGGAGSENKTKEASPWRHGKGKPWELKNRLFSSKIKLFSLSLSPTRAPPATFHSPPLCRTVWLCDQPRRAPCGRVCATTPTVLGR